MLLIMDNISDSSANKNYSFYDANIVLPRVKRLSNSNAENDFRNKNEDEGDIQHMEASFVRKTVPNFPNKKGGMREDNQPSDGSILLLQTPCEDDKHQLFVPRPPSKPKPQASSGKLRAPRNGSQKAISTLSNDTGQNTDNSAKNVSKKVNDKELINLYKDFLNERYGNISGPSENDQSSDSDFSVSSLTGAQSSDGEDELGKTLTNSLFQPLYSIPIKNENKESKNGNMLNKIVISNSRTHINQGSNLTMYKTGSLPDLRSIDKFDLKKVSHVVKNESEAESEPGAQIGYKFRPLPPIPGTSSNISTGLYETIDGRSKKYDRKDSKHRSFKEIATFLTLVPKLTTNSVRSRKNDHRLADINQYLPDKKLKIFVGTWNMKGTKFLPDSLDDFLLPPQSIYLQDIYVIGTQEGTPFRREWQVRLQETFGPSHVLMQSSNFGVLQLSVFVRRELVWFCSSVEQDTTATRMGHKIKTKGALAMSFSIFGTSFLFITSHFTSHEGKLRDRINDYRSICQNIQLPYADPRGEERDVTTRFDRVFWFGDFNFRVKKPRDVVDKLIHKHRKSKDVVIKELLQHDQLNDVFSRGKIFQGFVEAPIYFMPTYKFDVNTNIYDTSSKQRVPSWTDRVMHKSVPQHHLKSLCYNSCNTIKNSDHRPVYAIFETTIEPYKSKFVIGGGHFDREVYVEANLRRNAPSGSQGNSHVCTIL